MPSPVSLPTLRRQIKHQHLCLSLPHIRQIKLGPDLSTGDERAISLSQLELSTVDAHARSRGQGLLDVEARGLDDVDVGVPGGFRLGGEGGLESVEDGVVGGQEGRE